MKTFVESFIILLLQVGIALKPNTGVDVVTEFVDEADMVLIMTVEPGMSNEALPFIKFYNLFSLLTFDVRFADNW